MYALTHPTRHPAYAHACAPAGQAAFGAPIGGVLFSMEEACTHWSRKVAVRCFVCTTVAVCTVGLLNPKRAPRAPPPARPGGAWRCCCVALLRTATVQTRTNPFVCAVVCLMVGGVCSHVKVRACMCTRPSPCTLVLVAMQCACCPAPCVPSHLLMLRAANRN